MEAPTASPGAYPVDRSAAPGGAVRPAGRRAGGRGGQALVLAVIALGGGLGAAARYGAGLAWPVSPGAFPWTTLMVNVVGCAVIGVFMVVITELWAAHPLLRPFFGTGVLGGFTTFSTYAVEAERLLAEGRITTALAYLAATVIAALISVWFAATLTRRALGRIAERGQGAWRGWKTGRGRVTRAVRGDQGDHEDQEAEAGRAGQGGQADRGGPESHDDGPGQGQGQDRGQGRAGRGAGTGRSRRSRG